MKKALLLVLLAGSFLCLKAQFPEGWPGDFQYVYIYHYSPSGWGLQGRVQPHIERDTVKGYTGELEIAGSWTAYARGRFTYAGTKKQVKEEYAETFNGSSWNPDTRKTNSFNLSGYSHIQLVEQYSSSGEWDSIYRRSYLLTGSRINEFSDEIYDDPLWKADARFYCAYLPDNRMDSILEQNWLGENRFVKKFYYGSGQLDSIVKYDMTTPARTPSEKWIFSYAPVGISAEAGFSTRVYPQPCREILFISSPPITGERVSISDLNGRIIPLESSVSGNVISISTGTLTPGSYLLEYNNARKLFLVE